MRSVILVILLMLSLQSCSLFVDGSIKRDISATYAVTKALGLENKSSAYLALYTADKDKILESLEIISKTVKQILGHFHGA